MKISVCIPTMDRWSFLQNTLPQYINNPLIDEIVICDENGNDVKQIQEHLASSKLRLFTNETCLGALYNKIRVVSHATNDWVCLIDSDNYAPPSYFNAWIKYCENHGYDKDIIYSPCRALYNVGHCRFDYSSLLNKTLNKNTVKDIYCNHPHSGPFFNGGNYIVNKNAYLKDIPDDLKTIANTCGGFDVVMYNYILLINNISIVVVPEMDYHHAVHNGSYWLQTSGSVDYSKIDILWKSL
jgi:glycosyltransferase involved in cell wall biosynthesis